MFSSDEEDDVILEKVSNYYFVDETDQPISFAVLPFQTSTSELRGHLDKIIFMCGDVVSTNSKMYELVASGDTIVDFSCGSNDFSWLLKTRLEQTGKKCFYKNYDIFHPKGHTTEREIASKERGKPMKVIKKQKVEPAVLGVVSKSDISIIGNQNRPHHYTHACTSTGSGGLHVSASAGDGHSYSQKCGMLETGNQDCASNSGHGYSTYGETQVQLPTLVNDNIPETSTFDSNLYSSHHSQIYSSHYGLMHASGFDATMQPSPYGQHTAYGFSYQFDATLHPSSYLYEQHAAYGFSYQSGSDSSFGMSHASAGHGYAGLNSSAPQGYAPHPFAQPSPSATGGALDQVTRPWSGSSYDGSMLGYHVHMPPDSAQQEQLNPQVATTTEDLMNSSMSHHKG